MSKPRVAVFVTGQLRNASEHIENWLENGFPNCDAVFFFTVWDEIGHVDPSRMYQRSLRSAQFEERCVEISESGVYLCRYSTLEHEIQRIEHRLGENCSFRVVPYEPAYLRRIDELEMPEALAKDTHPFWQGCVPMAYMNKRAMEDFQASQSVESFDAFCRIQGETTFSSANDIDWIALGDDEKRVLTSPDTVSPEYQLSVKFFAAALAPFQALMNAYYTSIEAWQSYVPGSPWEEQPIGERLLKRICEDRKYRIDYTVRTAIMRQRMYPVHPTLRTMESVKASWGSPTILDVSDEAVDALRAWEAQNPLVQESRGDSRLKRWLGLSETDRRTS